MRQWRLVSDYPMTGAQNMAVDMAILEAVRGGEQPPTLRFYAWQPACLSLGYAQTASDVDFAAVAERGWTVVRRPTGGKAILHTDELTYSLALPESDSLTAGGIVESYRRISGALSLGLQHLGVNTQADAQSEQVRSGAVCFEVPSHYEITAGGRKLIGSAQVRRGGGVLQHGSLPLDGDIARICDALVYADAGAREAAKAQVRQRAATLYDVSAQPVTWQQAADAIMAGFSQAFAVEWRVEPLSSAETTRAQELQQTLYATEAWTRKR